MDADTIRKLPLCGVAQNAEQNALLREIAAQLSEISFHLSDLCYKADFALGKREHGK